jgi:hypothetical protein
VAKAIVLLLGFNSERRLSGYMKGYMKRAKEIEREYGLNVLTFGALALKDQGWLISNAVSFALYYAFFAIAWLLIWLLNLLH